MKVRYGFVSNSSSTSFICEVCNRTEVGWDSGSVTDYDMVTCINEHTFCTEHLVADQKVKPSREVPESACPICSYIDMSYCDIKRYFLQTTPYTIEEVFVGIKAINKRRKKVYDNEYVEYVLKAKNITSDDLLNELKNKYPKYPDFMSSLRG